MPEIYKEEMALQYKYPAFHHLEMLKEKGLCKEGFPMLHSIKQNAKQAEILMEALGPNLRKLRY